MVNLTKLMMQRLAQLLIMALQVQRQAWLVLGQVVQSVKSSMLHQVKSLQILLMPLTAVNYMLLPVK